MTEAERKSFFNYTSSRAPGKRQIKPTAAVLDLVLPNADDEDDDEDFIADHDDGSTECSDSDCNGSDEDSSSSSEKSEIERNNMRKDNEIVASSGIKCDERTSRTPICALCLNLSPYAKTEEMMRCDRCGLTVHDTCYPTLDVSEDNDSTQSSSSMEPWFCEPCIYGFQDPPYCELCPSRYGAMKRSDVGGRWVHLICALYTRGVTFGDIDHLSAVSWQEMDHRNFGRKSCNGCMDVLEARSGVTTRCEVGLCKMYYHITCAQRLGLLVDHSDGPDHHGESAVSYRHGDHHIVEPRYITCKQHSNSDDMQIKKLAATNFIMEEQNRLLIAGRNVLSEREERKRLRAKEKYDKQFRSLMGVTICLPEAFHDKADKKLRRARHLTTSPEFFEWFQEKAEISGIEPKQFRQEFTKVPGDFIPFLTPGFSTQFFEYLENRERNVIATEESKLQSINDSKVLLKKQLESQMTRLKLNEQSGLLGKERSEKRKQLANAFQTVLMRLGAKKISDISSLFVPSCESAVNGKTRSQSINSSPIDTSDSPPKLQREISINICKECGKSNDQHLMVGCDSCYEFYHIGCLDPPLEKVPKKVNCEWHCAECCESDDEETYHEFNGEISNEGMSKRLRQRSDTVKTKRLGALEEEKRAFRPTISGGVGSSSLLKRSPDFKKMPLKPRSLDFLSRPPPSPKRQRLSLANGETTNGLNLPHQISDLPEGELGEDCFVILDDDERELMGFHVFKSTVPPPLRTDNKPIRGYYMRSILCNAVKQVMRGTMTVTQAARHYKIPRTTVQKHFSKAREQHILKSIYTRQMKAAEQDHVGDGGESLLQQCLSDRDAKIIIHGTNIWPIVPERTPALSKRQQPAHLNSSSRHIIRNGQAFFEGSNLIASEKCEIVNDDIDYYERLHYGLPPQARLMGDMYVKDEFRRHKDAAPEQFATFINEWTNYCQMLSKQLSSKGIVKGFIGQDLEPKMLDAFAEKQLQQLLDLKLESERLLNKSRQSESSDNTITEQSTKED
ncbi:PHD-finger [Dictyocaulus viviparus]|uniref:PHD-finger n=1 Tax=Dictyocaulus viviparus TaxID=29172 RepID=A0A0D8YBP3_DICVI|nr:PHD-finger [Dictyocaulus viviparus]